MENLKKKKVNAANVFLAHSLSRSLSFFIQCDDQSEIELCKAHIEVPQQLQHVIDYSRSLLLLLLLSLYRIWVIEALYLYPQ